MAPKVQGSRKRLIGVAHLVCDKCEGELWAVRNNQPVTSHYSSAVMGECDFCGASARCRMEIHHSKSRKGAR
jgi:RNase P subunit RPR2